MIASIRRYDEASDMKPNVPGNTEAERMSNALRKVLSVSKEDLRNREADLKRQHEKKLPRKPSS